MSRKSTARRAGAHLIPPPSPATRTAPAERGQSGWTQLLEQQAVAATFLLDPDECDGSPAVVRVEGRRQGATSRRDERDSFVREEVVEEVLPGSGPLSLTARVYDVNPGEWSVTAELLPGAGAPGRRSRRATRSLSPAAWSWRRWALMPAAAGPIESCPAPLARIGRAPAMIPGIWGALVGIGILLATIVTAVLFSHFGLSVRSLLLVALISVLAGAIGGKLWYIAQSAERRFDGWCIQGFVVGLVAGAVPALALTKLPVGNSLDIIAPGLFLAMAVGRVGCFFAGCCGGRPTASRWGVWSSDQRVGARRIPTQLLESALALALGLAVLAVLLARRPTTSGVLLVVGLAAYTLGRQGLLSLRLERRRSRARSLAVAAIAAIVLVAGVATLLIRG